MSTRSSALYLCSNSRLMVKKKNNTTKKSESSKQIYDAWRDKLVFFNSM